MRKELIDILCCPICKGDIIIDIEQENDKEILKGEFFCNNCNEHYPIDDGIPNMIPSGLRENW